jgi:hypothetical protein
MSRVPHLDAVPCGSLRRAGLALSVLCSLLVSLPGCATHYAPVLVPTLECKLADTLLAGCEAPGAIRPDMPYGEVIKLAQSDRQKLARCNVQQQDLATAVRLCNQAIAAHNVELARSNDEQRSKAR